MGMGLDQGNSKKEMLQVWLYLGLKVSSIKESGGHQGVSYRKKQVGLLTLI